LYEEGFKEKVLFVVRLAASEKALLIEFFVSTLANRDVRFSVS
jgi:hypothetical protein